MNFEPALIQSFRDASTADELIHVFKTIPQQNADIYRSGNIRDILLSKRQLLQENARNDELVASIGYLFLWFIPQHQEDPRRFEIGRKVFATQEIANLFIEVLLPSATTQDSIYCIARSVCRVGYAHDGAKFFGTPAAVHEITSIVQRATEPKAVQFAVTIINNLTHDDEATELRSIFSAPENVKLLFAALDKSRDPEVTAWIAGSLINTSLCRDQVLLEAFRTQSAVNSLLRALKESATTGDSVDRCVRAIINIVIGSESAKEKYQTPEATAILLDSFDHADEPLAVESLGSFISHITRDADEKIRNLYKTPHAVSQLLKGFAFAGEDAAANNWLINTLYVLVYDPATFGRGDKSNDAFTTQEVANAIMTAQSNVERDDRHRLQCLYIITTLTSGRGDLLKKFLAVDKPLNAIQTELLSVATENQLVKFLERRDPEAILPVDDDVERHRSFQFLLDKTLDLVETQEAILVVAEALHVHYSLFTLLRDEYVDAVALALLNRATGEGTIAVAKLIAAWLRMESGELQEPNSTDDDDEHHITPHFTPAVVDSLLCKFETELNEATVDEEGFTLAELMPQIFAELYEHKFTSGECKALVSSRRMLDAFINASPKCGGSHAAATRALRSGFQRIYKLSDTFKTHALHAAENVNKAQLMEEFGPMPAVYPKTTSGADDEEEEDDWTTDEDED